LLRSWRESRTSGPAFLDDYALLGDGLLTLYETRFEPRWWHEAMRLGRTIVHLFADQRGGFYDTGSDVAHGVVRPKDLFDNAMPSGNSAASDLLLRLAALSDDATLEDAATGFLRLLEPALRQAPSGFGQALSALDRALGPVAQLAIVGEPGDTAFGGLLGVARDSYRPNLVTAAGGPDSDEPALLRQRVSLDGKATAYLCRDFLCKLPVTEPADLREMLSEAFAQTGAREEGRSPDRS
jgi:uncharacterized protein YyaL (SSP411 family)